MTAPWSDWQSRPEVVQWYERVLRWTLDGYRESAENPAWFREALDNPDIFEWVVQWYVDRQDRFAVTGDPYKVWLSDLSDVDGPDQRIMFNEKAVSKAAYDVVEEAQRAMVAIREAQDYPDLDGWLEALHAGELEWDGPSEKDGEKLVDDRWDFRKAARRRRNSWPKRCRVCGAQFRPKPVNVRSCGACLDKMRADRQAKRPHLEIVR